MTGDKLETAVNIAFSCGHFKRTMEILELSGTGRTETVLNDLRYYTEVNGIQNVLNLVLLINTNFKGLRFQMAREIISAW